MKVFDYIRPRIKTLFITMNKRIYILLSLIITSLLVIIAILYSKNQSFDNRLNTLFKGIEASHQNDSIITQKESYKAQFKEDYYIQQQSNDTTLILCVFGFVVVIFGFLSYNSFIHQIEFTVNKMETKYDDHLKKYDGYEHKLNSLMSEFYESQASFNLERAKDCVRNKEDDWHVYYTLLGISYYADRLKIETGTPQYSTTQTILVKHADDYLGITLDMLNKVGSVRNIDDELIRKYIQKIEKLESVDVSKKVMLVYNKLTV